MQVSIKTLREDIDLPTYETEGAVGFDIATAHEAHVPALNMAQISTGLVIEVPAGYGLFIVPRSSTPKKWGVTMPHNIGVIDQDYCGPEDELRLQVYNFTSLPAFIPERTKLAQGIFMPIGKAEWSELFHEDAQLSRGGFGSTDKELDAFQ